MMNDAIGGGFRGAGSMPGGGDSFGGGGSSGAGGGGSFGGGSNSAPGSATFGGNPIVQPRNGGGQVSGPIVEGSYGFADGGMVPDDGDPGQGQEGGIPMSGAAQPAQAGPGQRLQNAGNMVQMLLMHGMKKHNLMGPDGKPMKVGAYAGGGLVRSFSLGGSLDAGEADTQPASAPSPDENGGGNEPQAQGAIPSMGGPGQGAGVPDSSGPSSVASQGSGTPSVMQYVSGADAPPDQVMDQLHSGFKKGGRSGNEAALAATAAAAEKSPDLGFSVVQGFRKRYDRSRAAAAQALDMGNLDGGVSHLNDAFNNLPTQENANFSHDGKNITASVNGKSYPLSPKFASNLLAKGNGGHFDNIMFTGLDQPLATIGATTLAAQQMSASAGNPRQPSQPTVVAGGQTRAPGVQVAASRETGALAGQGSNVMSDAEYYQKMNLAGRRGSGTGTADDTDKELRDIEEHLLKSGKTPADVAETLQQIRESKGLPRTRPAPTPTSEPPDHRGILERNLPTFLGGKPRPTAEQPAAPATAPQQPAGNAGWQHGDPVPQGYKMQTKNGQYRIVPAGP